MVGTRTNLVVIGNVSDQLKRDARDFLDSLPDHLVKTLKDAGIRVGVATDFGSVAPKYLNEVPRGWPKGRTWAEADGAFLHDQNQKIAFSTEFFKRDGKVLKSHRSIAVLRHETGHAVDSALGKASQSRQFQAAYNRDVKKLSSAAKSSLSYYLQSGHAGRSEAFAETFASLRGGSASGQSMAHHFPSVARYMRAKVFRKETTR